MTITLARTLRLLGHVKGPPDLPAVSLSLDQEEGDASLGRPSTTVPPGGGDFVLEGLVPSRYVLRLLPGSIVIRSVNWAGADYARRPIPVAGPSDITDVVVTLARGSVISGAVTDASNRPAVRAIVVHFPVESAAWTNYGFSSPMIGRALVGSDGHYRTAGLPAGDYYLAAVETDDSLLGQWQTPAFLRQLSLTASKVTIGWEQSHAHDLRVTVTSR